MKIAVDQTSTSAAARACSVGRRRAAPRSATDDATEVGGARALKIAKGSLVEIGEDGAIKVGKNLLIDAGDSIVLKCGSAAIAMKKDGTITIDGKDITRQRLGQDQREGVGRHHDEGLEDQPELRADDGRTSASGSTAW